MLKLESLNPDNLHVICHGDLDGVACGQLAVYFFPGCNIRFANYNNLESIVKEHTLKLNPKKDTIFILDMGPKKAIMDVLQEWCSGNDESILVVDHHKGNDHLNDYSFTHYNATLDKQDRPVFCGADLFLRIVSAHRIMPETIHDIFQNYCALVNVWDTWKIESPLRSHAEKLETLRTFWGNKKFLSRGIQEDLDEFEHRIVQRLQEQRESYINAKIKFIEKDTISFADEVLCVTFMSKNVSLAANAILNEYKDIRFLANINMEFKTVELRSRGGTDNDVSLIAKDNGGGGHKHAAGFPLEPQDLLSLSSVVNRILSSIMKTHSV